MSAYYPPGTHGADVDSHLDPHVDTGPVKCGYCHDTEEATVEQAIDMGWTRTRSHGLVCDECGDYLAAETDGPYEPTDPKHPGYHSLMADVWDMREGK